MITNFKALYNKYNLNYNKISVDQYHFLEHQKKFKDILENISSTTDQQNYFYKEVVNCNYSSRNVSAESILRTVNLPNNDLVTKEVVVNFTKHAIEVSNELSITNFNEKKENFNKTVENMDVVALRELADLKDRFIGIPIKDNLFFPDAVSLLSASIDRTSINHLITLIEYSCASEILTSLSFNQKLSIVLGFKLYAKLYFSFQEKGSFLAYLESVKTALEGSERPLAYRVFNVVKPSVPFLITGFASAFAGFMFRGCFNVPESLVVLNIDKYIPFEGAKILVLDGLTLVKGTFYTLGSVIGSARDALFTGLWGDHIKQIEGIAKTISKEIQKK